MTILNISQETLIMLPDGSTGGRVEITYNGVTVGPEIASGDDRGRAVLTSGRLAKLTALDGYTSLKVVGREAGGRVPARCTIRIYPEYPAGQTGPTSPITLTGLPVGHPDAAGIWMLDNIDNASGGMDVVTPAERLSLAALKEASQSAATAATTATLTAATAATEALTATTAGQEAVQSAISNTVAAIAQLGPIASTLRGLTVGTSSEAPLGGNMYSVTADPVATTAITVSTAPCGGLLYEVTT